MQQTTVAAVTPRFLSFLARWPSVEALAAAPLDDVLHEWQGLGYYARARNLHRCAGVVAAQYGGVFPPDEDALRALPGIGDYTAAAIAAIAFGQVAAPVDGNIIRVISRLMALDTIMPAGKAVVRDVVAGMVPPARPGDFAQAMMDLGATVCTPRKPDCPACPWLGACLASNAGQAEAYPRKAAKRARPTRHGVAFWLEDAEGRIMLRRRAEAGLLGGMIEVPSTDWREGEWPLDEALSGAPLDGVAWDSVEGTVEHTFTHFHLVLRVVRGRLDTASRAGNAIWAAPQDFGAHALPTVMKKVARHAR